jgi:hypothetical protein
LISRRTFFSEKFHRLESSLTVWNGIGSGLVGFLLLNFLTPDFGRVRLIVCLAFLDAVREVLAGQLPSEQTRQSLEGRHLCRA